MAEQDIPKKRSLRTRWILPLLIGTTISVIVGLFVLGYASLTTPPTQPDDIRSLLDQKQQDSDLAAADENTDNSTEMIVGEDGVFDFAAYRYFSFPLPFVVNKVQKNMNRDGMWYTGTCNTMIAQIVLIYHWKVLCAV